MLCDGQGTAVAFVLSQGQRHDAAFFHATLDAGLEARMAMRSPMPSKLTADKAYGANHIRERLTAEKIEDVIPKKRNEKPCSTDNLHTQWQAKPPP